jgi:Flp pilus assembly protein TadG
LVEFALVIPILALVLFGIFDFGRAVNYWNDENHLAEVAARYAAVGELPTTAQDPNCGGKSTLTAYIQCEAGLDSIALENGCTPSGSCSGAQGSLGVCVSIPPTDAVGDPVTVKLTARYNWMPLPTAIGGSSAGFAPVTLAGTATMRLEQIPLGGDGNFETTPGSC